MNHTHAVNCYDCPAGYYCELAGQSIICPAGYYCPAGTGLDWMACPRGTYSDVQGLYDESQCKPCPAGKYCGEEHLTAVSGTIEFSLYYSMHDMFCLGLCCFLLFPFFFL